MVDENSRQNPGPARNAPHDAFDRALGTTMLACVYLGAAIHNRDVEDVQRAASDVVEAWLGMRSILRWREFASRIAGDPRLPLARSATRMYRRTLVRVSLLAVAACEPHTPTPAVTPAPRSPAPSPSSASEFGLYVLSMTWGSHQPVAADRAPPVRSRPAWRPRRGRGCRRRCRPSRPGGGRPSLARHRRCCSRTGRSSC